MANFVEIVLNSMEGNFFKKIAYAHHYLEAGYEEMLFAEEKSYLNEFIVTYESRLDDNFYWRGY
jgi:hypothetical protein